MNLDQCYQLFDLQPGASATEVKAAYRRLARAMHPDLNPADRDAHRRFVTLHQAYQALLHSMEISQSLVSGPRSARSPRSHPTQPPVATLSKQEADLKWSTYRKLQELLQQREFHKAVALVDGLAQRISHDLHVRQWQGIVYYFLGQHLVDLCQVDKAKIYLKKALKADPQNKQLGQQVDWEYQRIEQIMTQL
jgi:tetratricopeptide (TPR) repeat protein